MLVYKNSEGPHVLSGGQYINPSAGTARLNIRTGTGDNDIVKYGWTTNSSATAYCPIRAVIKHNVTAYIGRTETTSQSYSYTSVKEGTNTEPPQHTISSERKTGTVSAITKTYTAAATTHEIYLTRSSGYTASTSSGTRSSTSGYATRSSGYTASTSSGTKVSTSGYATKSSGYTASTKSSTRSSSYTYTVSTVTMVISTYWSYSASSSKTWTTTAASVANNSSTFSHITQYAPADGVTSSSGTKYTSNIGKSFNSILISGTKSTAGYITRKNTTRTSVGAYKSMTSSTTRGTGATRSSAYTASTTSTRASTSGTLTRSSGYTNSTTSTRVSTSSTLTRSSGYTDSTTSTRASTSSTVYLTKQVNVSETGAITTSHTLYTMMGSSTKSTHNFNI